MKLVKSLLLGSAAGLAAVAGAQAADLPDRKAAPVAVEYVRVCSTYGAGFFYIPGTDTCLRIGGRVRADDLYVEPFTRADDAIGFRAAAASRSTPAPRPPTACCARSSASRSTGTGTPSAEGASHDPDLAQAFIQFGGLTAGRVTSFFSNADLPTSISGTLRFDDAPDVDLFAYTFSFGNGFSATISSKRVCAPRASSTRVGIPAASVRGPVRVHSCSRAVRLVYGGQTDAGHRGEHPLRGHLGYGSALRRGAPDPRRRRSGEPVRGCQCGLVPACPWLCRAIADTSTAARSDCRGTSTCRCSAMATRSGLSGTYSSGAASYSGFAASSSVRAFGRASTPVSSDAAVGPVTGDLDKTHIWKSRRASRTTGRRSSVRASSVRSRGSSSADTPVWSRRSGTRSDNGTTILAGANVGFADFNEWRIGANAFWTPVSGLNLGVEVIYAEARLQRPRHPKASAAGSRGSLRLAGDVGAIEGRLRIQRDF